MTHPHFLTQDQQDILRRLVRRKLTIAETMREFAQRTSRPVSMNTVHACRQRLGLATRRRRGGKLVEDIAKDGLCCRCRNAPATLPGAPVGMPADVCLRCHKAVIEQHAEERWALAQQQRASA